MQNIEILDCAAGGHVSESDIALQRDPTPSIPAGAARRSPAHAGIPSRCIRAHAASPAPAAVVRPRCEAAASGGASVVRTTQWRRWPRPSAPAPSGRRRPAEPASLSRGPRRCGRRHAGRRPFGGGGGGRGRREAGMDELGRRGCRIPGETHHRSTLGGKRGLDRCSREGGAGDGSGWQGRCGRMWRQRCNGEMVG